MVSRGSLHRPNPESKVQPPDMLSVIIKWFRRCRPRCRKMAKQMAQGEGGGSRRCKLSQREARLKSGKNGSAMLKRIYAKESRRRVGRKERLSLSFSLSPVLSQCTTQYSQVTVKLVPSICTMHTNAKQADVCNIIIYCIHCTFYFVQFTILD